MMMTRRSVSHEKQHAENSNLRLYEGGVAPVNLSRGSLRKVLALGACASLGVSLSMSATAEDRHWIGTGGTSVATATDFHAPANWQDSAAPGVGDKALFDDDYSGSRFVKFSSAADIAGISTKRGENPLGRTYFFGSPLTLRNGTKSGVLYFIGTDYQVHEFWTDIVAPYGFAMTHTAIAGDITAPSSATVTFSAGTLSYDASRHANSPDAVRYPWGKMTIGQIMTGSPTLGMTGPRSSDESVSAACTAEVGSRYVTVDANVSIGSLVPGQTVTGGNLPSGTYLKRILADQIVELSEEAVETSFTAEFHPHAAVVHLDTHKWYLSGGPGFYIDSLSPNTLVLEAENMEMSASYTFKINRNNTSRYPATWIFHNTKDLKASILMGGVNLEFALPTDPTQTAGFPSAKTFGNYSGETTGLIVTNGISAVLPTFEDVNGTVAKRGAGTLTAPVDAGNTGTLAVEEGAFAFAFPQTGEAPEGQLFAAVTVSAGATLRIPEGLVVTVGSLSLASGAVIEGPGVIAVNGAFPDLTGVVFRNGALIRKAGSAGLPVTEALTGAGEVVGNPAFWCAADDVQTMVLDGNNGISRWNDKRGEGYMFATNIIEKPLLVTGGSAGNYVKFEHLSLAQHWITNEQVLVWSEIAKNIRVIFAMVDPTDGGGSLLGRSTRIPDNCSTRCGDRGFFGRNHNATTWWVHMWDKNKQPTGTRLFIDGDSVPADATYREPAAQLVEIHLPAGNDIQVDAFGTGASDGSSNSDFNGKVRAHEYIVYTNELTAAQRQSVAQYLMKKWLKRDAPLIPTVSGETYAVPATETGVGLDVDAGETVSIGEIGAGGLVKGGEGAVYLDSASGGNLRLTDGSAVIRSFGMTSATLPGADDCYLHLDATVSDSMVKSVVNGTNFVTRWNDVRGTTGRHYVIKAGSGGGVATSDGWLHEGIVNNRPMVDLGPLSYASGSWAKPQPFCALRIMTPAGAEVSGVQHNGANGPSIYSVFMAYDSSGGGNALLSGRGSSWPSYGLLTDRKITGGAAPSAVFACTASRCNYNSTGLSGIASGLGNFSGTLTPVTRQNGETFDPFRNAFSGKQDVFSLSSRSWPRKTGGFAIEQYDNYVGGLMFGEILLYTNFVGQAETKQIEAYLLKKWKGIDTPGYTASSLDDLTLENGATATVFGGAPLTVGALDVSGGTVSGAIRLAEGATVRIPVDETDGSLGCTSLDSFDCAGNVVLEIVGNARKIDVSQPWPVLEAPGITASDLSRFSLSVAKAGNWTFTLSVADGKVFVQASKPGLILLVK